MYVCALGFLVYSYICLCLTSFESGGSRSCSLSQNPGKQSLAAGSFVKGSPRDKQSLPSEAAAEAGELQMCCAGLWGKEDQEVTLPGRRHLSSASLALLHCPTTGDCTDISWV